MKVNKLIEGQLNNLLHYGWESEDREKQNYSVSINELIKLIEECYKEGREEFREEVNNILN